MGRELKRVPLDFQWPENKVWSGYINTHYAQSYNCPECGGSGYSEDYLRLKALWYGYAPFKPEDRGSVPFLPTHPTVRALAERNVANNPEYYGSGGAAVYYEASRLAEHFNSRWMFHLNALDVAALVAEGRLRDFTHTYTPERRWQPKEPAYTPTPEEVNAWSLSGFGHDSISQYVVVSAECERLGLEPSCLHCQGAGILWETKEAEQAAEDWTRTQPPMGEGYQVWETVSEGSPISPVFATPEELARHMAGKPWGADKGSTYETWMAFICGPGWAPSMIINDRGIHSGPGAAL